jgi:Tfp pilus assembly protein PilV
MPSLLRGDAGETLVELLVTVVIMSIAVVALVAGLGTAAITSDMSARNGTAQAVLRSGAEAVKAQPYVGCATTYTVPAASDQPGFTAEVTNVAYAVIGAASGGGSVGFVPTCSVDAGAQRVAVRVSSTDGRVQRTVQIVKRR